MTPAIRTCARLLCFPPPSLDSIGVCSAPRRVEARMHKENVLPTLRTYP